VIDTKLSSLSGRVKYRYRCSISKVQVVVSLVNRESDCLLVQDDAWSGSWMLPQFGSASNVCFVPRSAVLGFDIYVPLRSSSSVHLNCAPKECNQP